jgi:hypothetical protein
MPVVYDRDAGTPSAPAIMSATEANFDIPLSSPQNTRRPPARLSSGDADGDGRTDIVTLAPTTVAASAEVALFRGMGNAGSPTLGSVWNSVRSDAATLALLANFVPEEPGAQAAAPRSELILTAEPSYSGGVAAPFHSKLMVFRVGTATPLTPLFDTPYDLAAVTPPGGVSRAVALRAADLDADGKVDLVVALDMNPVPRAAPFSQGGVVVIWGDAAMPSGGAFPYAWQMTSATFLAGATSGPIAAHPKRIVVADLDGDCRPEIALSGIDVSGNGEQVSVIRVGRSGPRSLEVTNAGVIGAFMPTTNGNLVAIDLERDGRRALLVTEAGHWQIFTVPLGSGALVPRQVSAQPSNNIDCFAGDYTCVTGISGPVVADFDHDGAEDLLHWGFFLDAMPPPNYTGALFYRNDSLGALSRTPAAGISKRAAPNEVTDALVVDLDKDGHTEIVLVDYASAQVSLLPVRP